MTMLTMSTNVSQAGELRAKIGDITVELPGVAPAAAGGTILRVRPAHIVINCAGNSLFGHLSVDLLEHFGGQTMV